MRLQHSIWRALPAAATALMLSAAASGAGWWNVQWTYRRAVGVGAYKPTRLPGTDVGVVTMPTGGLIQGDGRDVRVLLGSQKLPHRVLMVGPGDQVKIAFALRPGVRTYYVYFGNDKADAGKPLDVRRGVLLEMWNNPGGPTGSIEQVRNIFGKVSGLIGRGFRTRMYQGHNPFGPQSDIACIYTGWLICPANGTYVFSSSSRNASFLLIDDQVVVENGGSHEPQRDVRMRGRIHLKAGLHKLTFYHVSGRGDPVATAAWRPPGGGRIWPIPAGSFAPIVRATAGALHKYGAALTVDFLPVHAGEAFMQNRYYQRYSFRAVASGQRTRGIQWTWDFGDGQTATGAKVEHVYLTFGRREVTLTAKAAAQVLTRTNRIYVSRPWDRVASRHVDRLGDYARTVAGYDFTKLDAEANAQAVLLLERTGQTDALLRAGEAFVSRDAASGSAVNRILPIYADALVARGKPALAVDALLKGVRMTTNISAHVNVLVRAGRVSLDELGKTEQAMKLFDRVVRKYAALTSVGGIREARIGIGDVWRLRGDHEQALAAYTAARDRVSYLSGQAPIKKGDFGRHVEDYLRRGLLGDAEAQLDAWEKAFPTDKLEGYSTLMRVRLLLARKRYAEAAREAEILVRVNPGSNYAAELLMKAAEAYRKLGKVAQADGALKLIVSKYPESSLAEEAANKLKP